MFKEIWHDVDRSSRIGIISGVVIILLLSIAAGYWLLRDKKDVLFADLQPADASAVVAELERMKVDYELGTGGTRILVSEKAVPEVRLKLMGSGLAMNGGLGFEIFDNSEFGMTEFAQRINFQRALQGELTRTIMSLEEVKFARVHLVMPQASLFKQNKNPPSASVTLFLKPGKQLNRQQTEGIQRLVSASVPGLEASMVTIVDQKGNTMSRVLSGDQEVASVSTRLQKKQEVEDYLIAKVTRVLERAFGPGKAIVSIDVTLNFDQEKTTREEVIPHSDENGEMIRKRESRSAGGQGKDKSGGDLSTEVEYRLGRSVAQIVSTPGNIQRLSVGVLVPQATGQQRLKQIQDLVAMTVGFDSERGDAIAVHSSESEITFQPAVREISTATQNRSFAGLSEMQSVDRSSADSALTATGELFDTQTDIAQSGSGYGAIQNPEQVIINIAGWVQKMWHRYTLIISVMAALLTSTLWLLVHWTSTARRRRVQVQSRKTAEEREKILGQLREWMNADELSAQPESGAP